MDVRRHLLNNIIERNSEDPLRQENEFIIVEYVNNSKNGSHSKNPDEPCLKSTIVLWWGPLSIALMEGAGIGKSLWTGHTTSLPIIIPASLAAFLASFGLTGESFANNFSENCYIFNHRHLPPDWPNLSKQKESLAILLAIPPLLLGPFSEAAQAFYFIDSVPQDWNFHIGKLSWAWSLFGIGVSGGVGVSTILNDNFEMYKIIRNYIAGVHNPYQNKFSRYLSPVFGCTFGALKAFQDAIQGYIAVKTIFNVAGTLGKVFIGTPCLINAIPKFGFESFSSLSALDAFFGYLAKRKIEYKNIMAFFFSAVLAIYLAFLKIPLNKNFYEDVATDLKDLNLDPYNIPEETYNVLSYAIFIEESIRIIASIFHPMYRLVDKTDIRIRCFFHSMVNFLKCNQEPLISEKNLEAAPLLQADDEEEETLITVATQPKLSKHFSSFFCKNSEKETNSFDHYFKKVAPCVLI